MTPDEEEDLVLLQLLAPVGVYITTWMNSRSQVLAHRRLIARGWSKFGILTAIGREIAVSRGLDVRLALLLMKDT